MNFWARRPGAVRFWTVLAGGWALAACAPPEDRELLPRDSAVTVGTLANGLSYYIRENTRPKNRAELRLVVNAGSILEDDDQLGVAHFVEHMAFNGTARFPKSEIVDYLERIGMRFGADVNASTSFDQTVYELTVPTDSAEVMETAFAILREWAGSVSFEEDEVARERGVVLEEWRLGRGAWSRIADKQFPVLFSGSRYADRIPIGDPDVIRSLTPDLLRRFYRDWYRPDLMAVVAVGDFDRAAIEEQLRKHFADLTGPADPRPRPVYPVPGHAKPLYAIATDPEEMSTTVAVYYKRPARDVETVADFRTRLIERLFSSMINDRLFEIRQQPEAPFLYATIGQGRFVRPLEMWLLVAGVADGTVPAGLDALLTEVERVQRHGFTESELARHKTLLLRRMEQAFDEREKTNSSRFVGEYVRNYLEGEAFPGIEEAYRLYQKLMPGIRLDEVIDVAKALLVDSSRVALVSAPSALPVPEDSDLAAIFTDVEARDVPAYTDKVAGHELLSHPPEPGAVVSERRIDSLNVWDWHLANGVRVVLKPTDFQDDEIVFQAMSPGGSSLASDEDFIPASTATTIVSLSGIGDFDLVALQKLLAGKAVSVAPEIFQVGEGMYGRASPKDVETMFQLVYLYFTAPRRDTSAYVAFLQKRREMLRNRDVDPEVAFYDTLNAVMSQHHPRTRPFTVETFDEMDLDRSLAFYRERFADASDFTFVIVGRFEVDAIRPLVETYLGSLPDLQREETWIDRGISPPGGVVTRTVRKGIEPKSQTQLVFTGPFEYTRVNEHLLSSMGGILNIWLRESLREELGGTYGASVAASAERIPVPRYRVGIWFGSDPERVEEMTDRAFAEIERLKTEGPSADDLHKIQEMQLRARETNLRQNGYWLNRLMERARYGLPLDQSEDYDALVRSTTADEIRDAARRWLREDRYVLVTLLPEG